MHAIAQNSDISSPLLHLLLLPSSKREKDINK
jgi:hypothetical protein